MSRISLKTEQWMEARDVKEHMLKLSRKYHVTLEEMFSRSRETRIIRARHAAWSWLSEHLQWSSGSIGGLFEVDHTTVLSALKKVKEASNG